MKEHMDRALIRIYIFFSLLFLFTTSTARGLQFFGNSYRVEERTSYTVFQKNLIPSFENEVSIDFDLQIKEFNTFGYIFRLVDLNSKNVFSLVFTYKNDEESILQINLDGKTNYASISFFNDSIRFRWIPVSLKLNVKEKSILFVVGSKNNKVCNVGDLKEIIYPALYFGLDNFIVDVPTFALKNLRIGNKTKEYFFPLNENMGTDVHDMAGNVYGKVINPMWLINDSFYWKPLFKKNIIGACGSNFDDLGKMIYLFSNDSLYHFDLHDRKFNSTPYKNDIPLEMRLGTNFYSPKEKRIYVYEINGILPGNTTMASLDLVEGEWTSVDSLSLPVQLHHHNCFFNSKYNSLILFGGFGNQKYHNSFISYDFKGHKIDTIKLTGDVIAPRYGAGMASIGDSLLYIYGGTGNSSGEQTLGRVYFNDLYKVNLHTFNIKKCLENTSHDRRVVCGQMIYSESENALYALKYKEYKRNTSAQLYQISLDDKTIIPVGDSIPFLSGAIETTLSLYRSHMPEKLYCVIHEYSSSPNSDTVKVSAYELDFPPLMDGELAPYYGSKDLNSRNIVLFSLCMFLFAFLVIGVYYIRKKRAIKVSCRESVCDVKANDNIVSEKCNVLSLDSESQSIKTASRNTLFLFGQFTVYNRRGRDITYMFSNKLKNIFIYILFNSINGNGVQSSSLNALFWPDKDELKVKNLKGVTINHLRKILTEMDGISLIYNKGFFKLSFDSDFFCDYVYAYELINRKDSDKELFALLQRGELLKGIDDDLFDMIKSSAEDLILTYLISLLSTENKLSDKSDIIIVCQIIFKIDPLNEQALFCILNAYKDKKMRSEAQKYYSHFVREYKIMQGKEYHIPLEEFLKG